MKFTGNDWTFFTIIFRNKINSIQFITFLSWYPPCAIIKCKKINIKMVNRKKFLYVSVAHLFGPQGENSIFHRWPMPSLVYPTRPRTYILISYKTQALYALVSFQKPPNKILKLHCSIHRCTYFCICVNIIYETYIILYTWVCSIWLTYWRIEFVNRTYKSIRKREKYIYIALKIPVAWPAIDWTACAAWNTYQFYLDSCPQRFYSQYWRRWWLSISSSQALFFYTYKYI